MDSKQKTFGEWLREKREGAGLSLQDVADRAGVSKQYLSTIERSLPRTAKGRPPRLTEERVDAIAEAVGAPISEARRYARLREPDSDVDPGEAGRLLMYFKELPAAAREAAMTMTEALWRKQHAQRRAEREAQKKPKERRRA